MIFRRIHGHIVALNISQENRERAKGAGEIAAGVGVGVGAIHTGKQIVKNIYRREMQADRSVMAGSRASRKHFDTQVQPDLFKHAEGASHLRTANKRYRLADKMEKAAQEGYRRSGAVKNIGAVVGGSLIGVGTNKILKQTRLKDHEQARNTISSAAAAGSGFAIRQIYRGAINETKATKIAKDLAKSALKKAAKFAIRKL